jgi:L-ascorbate metabolism protein UlaG (beta-lactamase superfamily)
VDEAELGVTVRYLTGPTALLEIGGSRLLIDPTFDPVGEYPGGSRVLEKTMASPLSAEDVGPVDAVLLSHDQHPDNLDDAGREFLSSVPLVLSTDDARTRLGGSVLALDNWTDVELPLPEGGSIRVTGVPARHGPPGCESSTGPVTGFVVSGEGVPTVYVSGDNAALELVQEVADHFASIDVALLFAGAARTALLNGAFLTLTSAEAAEAAAILGARHIVPLHFEGWGHFTQGRDTLVEAFEQASLADRLHLLDPGQQLRL